MGSKYTFYTVKRSCRLEKVSDLLTELKVQMNQPKLVWLWYLIMVPLGFATLGESMVLIWSQPVILPRGSGAHNSSESGKAMGLVTNVGLDLWLLTAKPHIFPVSLCFKNVQTHTCELSGCKITHKFIIIFLEWHHFFPLKTSVLICRVESSY